MCEVLELSGYSVVAANDGKDALDKVSGIESLGLVRQSNILGSP
jgi:CheY-like chemotaxis protein